MNKIIIKTQELGEVEIKRLPLGKIVEILKTLMTDAPVELFDYAGKPNAEIVAALPNILVAYEPQVYRFISLVSDIPADDVKEKLGLEELSRILLAALEVNDIEAIKKNFTALWKSTRGKEKAPEKPTTGQKK